MAQDYLTKPLLFRLRKVARYLRLYGPTRTWAKIQAQRHLRRTEGFSGPRWVNPSCRQPDHQDRFVAIVGCGNFAYSAIAHHLRSRTPRFLRATHDLASARARSLCKSYGGHYACTDIDVILADQGVRLVYIASNHASHAEYAITCLESGKDVHIEKPQAVTEEQLRRLIGAQVRHPERMVFLGYNRPRSPHFRRMKKVLERQAGPTMINWFIAGHRIPEGHWYFSEEEGGRVLGNLCHWTDLSLALLGRERALPCSVVPVTPPGSLSDFSFGIRFNDGSVAAFTFSAKGHTFEGVREMVNVHRGDALLSMVDFKVTRIDVLHRRTEFRTFFRDHGHGSNIVNSFDASFTRKTAEAVSPEYNEATGRLILGVRRALESGREVAVDVDDN